MAGKQKNKPQKKDFDFFEWLRRYDQALNGHGESEYYTNNPDIQPLDIYARRLASIIKGRVNTRNHCFLSIGYIQEAGPMSHNIVRDRIKTLANQGWIKTWLGRTVFSKNRVHHFNLRFPDGLKPEFGMGTFLPGNEGIYNAPPDELFPMPKRRNRYAEDKQAQKKRAKSVGFLEESDLCDRDDMGREYHSAVEEFDNTGEEIDGIFLETIKLILDVHDDIDKLPQGENGQVDRPAIIEKAIHHYIKTGEKLQINDAKTGTDQGEAGANPYHEMVGVEDKPLPLDGKGSDKPLPPDGRGVEQTPTTPETKPLPPGEQTPTTGW